MGRKKTEEHHFLRIESLGRYNILAAMPGQTLRRKPVSVGITVKGCEKYRKSFPPGSIFGTTTLKEAHHKSFGFYQVEDLYFLGETDPFADLLTEPVRQQLMSEYLEYKGRKI